MSSVIRTVYLCQVYSTWDSYAAPTAWAQREGPASPVWAAPGKDSKCTSKPTLTPGKDTQSQAVDSCPAKVISWSFLKGVESKFPQNRTSRLSVSLQTCWQLSKPGASAGTSAWHLWLCFGAGGLWKGGKTSQMRTVYSACLQRPANWCH